VVIKRERENYVIDNEATVELRRSRSGKLGRAERRGKPGVK